MAVTPTSQPYMFDTFDAALDWLVEMRAPSESTCRSYRQGDGSITDQMTR